MSRKRQSASAPAVTPPDPGLPTSLQAAKDASTAQMLFKCARLLNEEALSRLRARTGRPVRTSHTLLLPHIDLHGTRPSVLAQRMGQHKQAVGQLVDEMVDMGFLQRVPDPADGRAVLVRFSAAGQAGMLQGLALLRELEAELARDLGVSAMRTLHDLLHRLLPVLQALADAPAGVRRGSK